MAKNVLYQYRTKIGLCDNNNNNYYITLVINDIINYMLLIVTLLYVNINYIY